MTELLKKCPACQEEVNFPEEALPTFDVDHFDAVCPVCNKLCCFTCGFVYTKNLKVVSYEQFIQFTKLFNAGRYTTFKHLRFGQAFMNVFMHAVSCPEVFYETDENKAVGLILTNFVDLSTVSIADLFTNNQ